MRGSGDVIALIVLCFLIGKDDLRAGPAAISDAVASQAVGVVYHDKNRNSLMDQGERGIEGVRVSNGRDIAVTDRHGRYRLPVGDDTIIFMIKPRDWMTPVNDNNLPQFYYKHKPRGSPRMRYAGVAPTGPLPESVDFPLYRHKEPRRFRVVLFGDIQTRNKEDVNYFAHDVVEELVGVDAAFGISLGDIVHNRLSLFRSVNETVAKIGPPWYNLIGNHDLNLDAPSDELSDETFESVYGPTYYSFDYGSVHFLLMDSVFWPGARGSGNKGRVHYRFGSAQLEFVRNDLSLVPENRLVVLLMHIPIPILPKRDVNELFRLLQDRPNTFSISGHLHRQEHRFCSEVDGWMGPRPHHHLIHATVSGSIWSGTPDEHGIPHATMSCGGPNGYSIVTFDGGEPEKWFPLFQCAPREPTYSIKFKAARRPDDYQMNIFSPNMIKPAMIPTTEILVNVFAGSERSTVEIRIGENGGWIPMSKVERPDPLYRSLKLHDAQDPYATQLSRVEERLIHFERELGRAEKVCNRSVGRLRKAVQSLGNIRSLPGRKLPQPIIDSPHLWAANLPSSATAGTHLIHVRTTDMFGHTYEACRVIQIRE